MSFSADLVSILENLDKGNVLMIIDDETVVKYALQGCDVHTLMEPDPSIPSNLPAHIECLHMNNIIINDNFLWGMSTDEICFKNSELHGNFNYSNQSDVFFTVCDESKNLVFMPKARYKKHNWKITKNYELIWDSSSKPWKNLNIKEAIENTRMLKFALLDAEDIWNIHRVALPYFNIEDQTFSFRNSRCYYPFFCRYPSQFNEIINEPDFSSTIKLMIDSHYTKGGLQGFKPMYPCSLLVNSTGTFQTLYDQQRGDTLQDYKRLLIFAMNCSGA